MSTDIQRLEDAVTIAMERARGFTSEVGIVGYGIIELRGPDGELKQVEPFANLITDAGDQYVAKKAIVAIGPANPSAPTAANGMKLGTGTTAAAKSGAGGALVTYLTASNKAFDSGYAQSEDLGAGNGWNAVHKTTWAAGEATNSAITEAVIINDSGTNATSTAANTYSRVVFTAVNKGASDTLAITWKYKFLGA